LAGYLPKSDHWNEYAPLLMGAFPIS